MSTHLATKSGHLVRTTSAPYHLTTGCGTPGCACAVGTNYHNPLQITLNLSIGATGCFLYDSFQEQIVMNSPNIAGSYCVPVPSPSCQGTITIPGPNFDVYTYFASGIFPSGCTPGSRPCTPGAGCTRDTGSIWTKDISVTQSQVTVSANSGGVSVTVKAGVGNGCSGSPYSFINFTSSGSLACGGSATLTVNQAFSINCTSCLPFIATNVFLTGTITVTDVACL